MDTDRSRGIIGALAAAALCAAALFALACDDDGGSPASVATASDPECTNQATRTAFRDATYTPGQPVVADNETRCRLRRALITTADLPVGTEVAGIVSSAFNLPVACFVTPPRVLDYGVVAGDWELPQDTADSDVVIVQQSISRLGEGDGARLLSSLRRACDHEYTRGSINFVERSIGDGIDALVVELLEGDITERTVVTFEGDIAIATHVMSRSDADVALAEELTRLAVSRLDRVGALPDEESSEGEGCLPPDDNDPDLAPALLRLEDMDYLAVEVPTGCGLIDLSWECDGERPRLPRDYERRASVAFVLSTNLISGPEEVRVSELALDYQGEADAELDRLFEREIQAVSCEATSGDKTEKVTIEPIEAPAIGERAVAWRMTNTYASYDTIVFQRGAIVAVLVIPAGAGEDPGIVATADVRLRDYVE